MLLISGFVIGSILPNGLGREALKGAYLGQNPPGLVPNSCFTAEMSVTVPVPEWGGKEFRLSLEQDIVFTGKRAYFLDGRQTKFHIIR